GRDARTMPLMTNELLIISSVVPSGAERATASVPMMVPAPGRFSITKRCPVACVACWVTMRASESAEPPGGNGTMMRMVLSRNESWAAAGLIGASMVSVARTTIESIFKAGLPLHGNVVGWVEALRSAPLGSMDSCAETHRAAFHHGGFRCDRPARRLDEQISRLNPPYGVRASAFWMK